MDTLAEITLFDNKNSKIKNDEVLKKIENFIDEWDARFSPDAENSEISRCNNRQSDTLEISSDLFDMLKISLFYGEKLDGYFDVSIKPLKDFWKISSRDSLLPDPNDSAILDDLNEVLQKINYKKISILEEPKRVIFENPETKIDLGAVAKGFAIGKIRDTLQNYGFQNFIINVGGDIFISGRKNGGKAIIAGIRNPQGDGLLKSFATDGGAVFTSGNYERFRIAKSGARVHHIFDVKTGFSVSKNVSLTITGKNPAVADILATGLFAFPADSILVKIKEFDGYEAFVVDSSGTTFETDFFIGKCCFMPKFEQILTLKKCRRHIETFFAYSPTSNGAKDYMDVANELERKIKQ